MDAEVAADLAAAEAGAQQQLRRAEGAAGGDHRPPGAHGVGAVAAARVAGRAGDADRAPVLDQDPLRLDPAAQARPGGDRARQVADVHPALGVDRAAVGAGAALDAVAGVAVDRPAAEAERRRALHRQLAVAAHPVRVELGDAEEVLGLGEVLVEVVRPGEAVLVAPLLEDRVGGAEAGAGVDHRGAADDLRHRHRDRRPAVGDRQARLRGRASGSPRAGRRGSCRGCSGRRPRARGRRRPASARVAAATAPPAPEPTITTSHSSPSPRGSVSPSEPAGSGRVPSASAQVVTVPIRASTSGATA